MIQVAHDAIQFLLSKGLSKDVGVGICAVLYAESGLKPGSQGTQASETPGQLNPSGAFGLASWNGPRQNDLKLYMDKYYPGVPYATMEPQLAFVLTEAAGFSLGSNPKGYPQFWAAITSPASHYSDVIEVMVDTYEIPADKPAEINRAMGYAKDFITYDFGPGPAVPPVPAPLPVPPSPVNSVVLDKATLAFLVKLLTTLEN